MRCLHCKTKFEPYQFRQKHCRNTEECKEASKKYQADERKKQYEKQNSKPRKPIKRSPIKRSTKPIAKVSKKRQKEFEIYTPLKKQYLKEHPKCERCKKKKSFDLHHKNGREGKRLYDIKYFMAVCRDCHDWIHLNMEEARKEGWIIRDYDK